MRHRWTWLTTLFAAWATAAGAQPDPAALEPDPLAEQIQREVAEIRGLPFKQPVRMATQSIEDFGRYLDSRIEQALPPATAQHYGKIVQKLGLYRGPEIEDGGALMKTVATSQAAAYYDPEEQTFYVLMQNMPELMRGTLYAHELYHGLQDQHFDLDGYLHMSARDNPLNADQQIARQSVVEGEATYVMNLWLLKSMSGSLPTHAMLEPLIKQQTQIGMESLRASLQQPQALRMMGSDMQKAAEAAQDLPAFILENMLGAYLKGLGFIFAVQQRGWVDVEKLYREYPPVSTEQILHPEKWFAREEPKEIVWPAFERERRLRDWQVLDQDVIGELQWRSIFKEHDFVTEADAIAAGWNGDRYAVFKHKQSDALLLLLYTSWDSEAEAHEFAEAYTRLLKVKYADRTEATGLQRRGRDVLIVEGGQSKDVDALLKFMAAATDNNE